MRGVNAMSAMSAMSAINRTIGLNGMIGATA
jgi:hypothetical protein